MAKNILIVDESSPPTGSLDDPIVLDSTAADVPSPIDADVKSTSGSSDDGASPHQSVSDAVGLPRRPAQSRYRSPIRPGRHANMPPTVSDRPGGRKCP